METNGNDVPDVLGTAVEEFTPVDPIEVEKRLLEEQSKSNPLESVYTMYGLYLPKFKEGLATLRHGQKDRLIKALVEYPLTENTFDGMTADERTIFSIGNSILQAKFIMFMEAYNKNADTMMGEVSSLTEEDKKELDKVVMEATFNDAKEENV